MSHDQRAVLVVDAANVVGSRPDGWWRDRPGAAARLHQRLIAADRPEQVILVLEGQARAGVPEGDCAGIRTVHATGSGDDDIAAQADAARREGHQVTVVTADRGLIARVKAVGAHVVGPTYLR
jgi:hypothetical protein